MPPANPFKSAPRPKPAPYGAQPDEQIRIAGFTLVRFSTGQILEDNFQVNFYDLLPHELVELHMSRPQAGFKVAVDLIKMLEVRNHGSGEDGVWWDTTIPEEKKGQPLSLSFSRHPTTAPCAPPAGSESAGAPITPMSVMLTSLARHDARLYVQPYWEGWVRCLRVVWRPDAVVPNPYTDYTTGHSMTSGGMGSGMVQMASALGPEEREKELARRKKEQKLEWRERWVVIRDGWVYLCRQRDVSDFLPSFCIYLTVFTFVFPFLCESSFFLLLFLFLTFSSFGPLGCVKTDLRQVFAGFAVWMGV
jgi:hypothetical protein